MGTGTSQDKLEYGSYLLCSRPKRLVQGFRILNNRKFALLIALKLLISIPIQRCNKTIIQFLQIYCIRRLSSNPLIKFYFWKDCHYGGIVAWEFWGCFFLLGLDKKLRHICIFINFWGLHGFLGPFF